ncbi:MAG: EAL domain-containing protein, partial [Actinomycetota bacterium]
MKAGRYDIGSDEGPAPSRRWKAILAAVEVAFQPIANIHTGRCFGYEVLLRGHEPLGYPTVSGFLDASHAAGMLGEVEMAVRRKAAERLHGIRGTDEITLFINLDRRLLPAAREFQSAVRKIFSSHSRLVTEVTHRPDGEPGDWPKALKKHGALTALDRFGESWQGLRLLHESDPDFLKTDAFCIRDIDLDARKRVVLSQMVAMAHTLGMLVIAVGVETERELAVCRQLGCDMVQGFFVQPPTNDPSLLRLAYPHVEILGSERPQRRIDQKWIMDQVDMVEPVAVDSPMTLVFERLAKDLAHTLIPVVDRRRQPLGIVRERNLKNFAYSTFGKDLIANKGLGRSLRDFLVHCPIAEISTSLDQMLAIFSTNEEAEGIILTDQMQYVGFLSARSIIRAIHEKTLANAREANPLTKLPGNEVINEYVAKTLSDGRGGVIAYIDFDNFKPFNDTYGFRQGDRAILLFAELMRRAATPDWFLGHIGGDDFFVGLSGADVSVARQAIGDLIFKFASDAESFYDAEARDNRCIVAQDREGT